MAQIFHIEMKDLKRLKMFFKRAPKQFHRASANVLNSFAFGTRRESINVIEDKMTVRSSKFVSGSFRIEKAKGNAPFNSQQSKVGSIRRDRFSGWEEQQTGKRRKNTRVGTLLSRGKSKSKTIRPAARMKRGIDFPSQDEFPGKSNMQKTVAMINRFKKDKRKSPFRITKNPKWKPGLYKLLRNKVKKLQIFDSRKAQPKRIKWMDMAVDRYFRKNPVRETWAKSIRHILKMK